MNLLILFIVSAVTLGLEILLTRVFSVVLFASHSFLAISLALLGTGSGAILAYFTKPPNPERRQRRQILLLALISLTLIISLWGLLQIEFAPQKIAIPAAPGMRDDLTFLQRMMLLERNPELFETWKLYAAIPLAFLPFFLSGYLQALVFRSSPAKFGVMYGCDLIGATFGSITLPLLLNPLGLKGTVLVMAALASLPILYALATRERKLWTAAALGGPFLVLAFLWGSGSFQVRFAAGFAEKDLIREHWSPMSRVALLKYRSQQMYVIDNGSRTFYVPKNEYNVNRYMRSLYTIPFQMKPGGDLLVIASGGGQELTMASHFGMNRIDAVEIAGPIVNDILQNQKDDPGNPYLLPNVFSHIADGRSVIMRSRQMYDLIEMLDVNFATVAGQISLAWSPNFISTQEAFSEYLDHLKPDGFLCYTLFSYSRSPVAGEKGRRLVSIVAGMKIAGIARPENHLAILSRPSAYGYQTLYLVKKTPFNHEELAAIGRIAASREAKIQFLFPDLDTVLENSGIQSGAGERIQRNQTYLQAVADLCRDTQPIQGLMANLVLPNQRGAPLSDDRPYLSGSGLISTTNRFESLIGGLYKPLMKTMGLLGLVFLVLPFIFRRPGGGEKIRIEPRLVMILALTGVGFMFIEMAGIYKYQLYLHHPTLAMIVVLSSMILGAGLGSLHSATIPDGRKEGRMAVYSGGVVLFVVALFLFVPLWGHRLLLWLSMPVLLPTVFVCFAFLGFLLGHVVPLAIEAYGRKQPNLLPWCWAITVTGSVVGTVLASILARDYGMSLVALLGIFSYLGVLFISVPRKRIGRSVSAGAGAPAQTES